MRFQLPYRERQIAELVRTRLEVTAEEVCAGLPDLISNSAVRSMLRRLETKGIIRRERVGRRFVYSPVELDHSMRIAALRRLIDNYFDGHTEHAVAMIAQLPKMTSAGYPARIEDTLSD